jgi:hypothetical protein
VIATEAFDLAGDPTKFPEQISAPRNRRDNNNLTEGLRPWQPKRSTTAPTATALTVPGIMTKKGDATCVLAAWRRADHDCVAVLVARA